MNNQKSRLYYYCRLSTAVEKILPNKQLLLNPLGKTNDPREYKDFVFARENMSFENTNNVQITDEHITNLIRKHCKMTCFSTDYKYFGGYEYSRMWALYGDNHTGVCIGIDKEKFIEENKTIIKPDFFKTICYTEFNINKMTEHIVIDYDRISKDGLYAYIHGELRPKHINYFFFTKDLEWESEHECRLIYFSQSKENEYCSIKNCLDSIFLGIDFNMNYLPSIKSVVSGTNLYKLDYKGVRLVPLIVS